MSNHSKSDRLARSLTAWFLAGLTGVKFINAFIELLSKVVNYNACKTPKFRI